MRPGPDLFNLQLPAPGLGQEWQYRISAALGPCEVVLVTYRLVTSIAVAVRSVALNVTDPQGVTKGRAEAVSTQLAGVTRRYTWGATGGAYQGGSGDNEHVPLQRCYVGPDDLIQSITNNIQVTDQLDRISLWLERFVVQH